MCYLSYDVGAYVSVDAGNNGTYIQWNLHTSLYKHIYSFITHGNSNTVLLPSISNSLDLWIQTVMTCNTRLQDRELCMVWREQLYNYFALLSHWHMVLIGIYICL